MKISTKNGKLATIMCAVLFMLAVFVVGKFMGYGATREFFIEGQIEEDEDEFVTEGYEPTVKEEEEEEEEEGEEKLPGEEEEEVVQDPQEEDAKFSTESFQCGSGAPPVPPPNGDKKESTPVGIVDETMGFPIS